MPKLASLGFEVETSGAVALVPDAAFAPDSPKGLTLTALLAEYRANKAQRGRPARVRLQFGGTSPLDIEGLLAKPLMN
jgi:hypothetical protein